MANYCYTNKEEGTIIRHFPINGKIPMRLKLGGKTFLRDITSEHVKVRNCPGNWPMVSRAAGVSAEQIPEVMEVDKKFGVKTEYTRDGNPIFNSKRHRDRYLRVHQMHDNDSFC